VATFGLPVGRKASTSLIQSSSFKPFIDSVVLENGIEVFDEKGTFKTFYETFKPSKSSDNYDDVMDVIITGKVSLTFLLAYTYGVTFMQQTDDRHAAAWGNFHFLGRVRLSDGLMVVSREAVCLLAAMAGFSLPNFFISARGDWDRALQRIW
jgi:hypothetical protein